MFLLCSLYTSSFGVLELNTDTYIYTHKYWHTYLPKRMTNIDAPYPQSCSIHTSFQKLFIFYAEYFTLAHSFAGLLNPIIHIGLP